MPRTREINGTEIGQMLARKAQERAALLAQADDLQRQAADIETQVFAPLRMDPNTFVSANGSSKRQRRSGNRAPKGAQAETIQQLLKANGGKITTQMAIDAFTKAGYNTAANAVLMRMNKQGMINHAGRGEWSAIKNAKARAR
jgi:hypothetical protein